ncbi:MAG: 4-hydroxythreonine-4-phosphate dehydrogenase PdxA [Candidatus Njordarchaeum guaymaensis]
MDSYKPLLGITMGDPAGIGPEIAVKALSKKEIYEICRPLIIGDTKIIKRALRFTNLESLNVRGISDPSEAKFELGTIDVLDLNNVDIDRVPLGKVSAEAGKASVEYIFKAVDLALKKEIDAIVTGPINKEAINKAGYHYTGHTELLKKLTKAENAVMLLAIEKLKVAHVTTHVSLKKAIELITKERVLKTLRTVHESFIKYFGIKNPRIAVASLNPHAGEGGLFGDEEIKQITPAIEEANAQGMNVVGPLPADTIYYKAIRGDFDVVIAMYHDQGHIPIKVLDFYNGVNITLGLPIIRTSVDHGTSFNRAGKGTAHPGSLIYAIKYASMMVQNLKKHETLS